MKLNKAEILILILLFLALFSNGATPTRHKYKKHRCHQDRWNNKPHKPGAAGNFKHDLSRY